VEGKTWEVTRKAEGGKRKAESERRRNGRKKAQEAKKRGRKEVRFLNRSKRRGWRRHKTSRHKTQDQKKQEERRGEIVPREAPPLPLLPPVKFFSFKIFEQEVAEWVNGTWRLMIVDC
jgi:hypothetical protein